MSRYVLLAGLAVSLTGTAGGSEIIELRTDVCVVGAGSGGYSAALAAARAGVDCILIEKMDRIGGTSTAAYVCNWEPGPGDPFSREIYDRLKKLPDAVGITSDHNPDRKLGSFGLWMITPGATYEQTLGRSGKKRADWRAVVFDPDVLGRVVGEMLAETGRCRLMLQTPFTGVEMDGRRVKSITALSADGKAYLIRAKVFIDSTGGVHLCRAAGFPAMLGPESKSRFNERFAPDKPGKTLNAISLCYRVHKTDNPQRQAMPDPPPKTWPRSTHVSDLPGPDLICNPLATVPGRMLIDEGYDACMKECKRRVLAQWHHRQKQPPFTDYEFHSFAPMLGIRETYRVVGEYVLKQQDLEAGLKGQTHPDVIAVADHSMDIHGAGSRRVHGEIRKPYGVPYRCLIPKGSVNLLAACRGASFSHIAASSCRLSRTIMQLGHAGGEAAAMAAESNTPVGQINTQQLRRRLDFDPDRR